MAAGDFRLDLNVYEIDRKLRGFIKLETEAASAGLRIGLEKASKAMARRLEDAYYDQEMKQVTLADSTKRRKSPETRKLIDPVTYKGAILADSWKWKITGAYTWKVYNDRYKPGGYDLASLHEFGTDDGHVPARPVIQQTFDTYKETLFQIIYQSIREQTK